MFHRSSLVLATLPLIAALAGATQAAEVRLDHKGIGLLGEAALAPGKSWTDGAILMVHGTMMHARMDTMDHLQKALLEQGRSNLAITLSFGVSDRRGVADCARPQVHRQQDAVPEIAAWVGWLKAQGASDIVLLGFSRGGNQTLRYMLEKPDPAIKRLVFMAPTSWEEMSVAGYGDSPAGELQKNLAEAEKLASAGRGDEMMRGVRLLNCPSATTSANAFLSYYRDDGRMNTLDRLGGFGLPTLVLTGTLDTVTPDLPNRLKGKIGPNVRVATIDGANHFFRDLLADEAAEAIDKFLNGG
jgi:pimeloyl-ACP methyl ester carboxylesterase